MAQTVEVLVEGGKATPGPPLGPTLGPLGVNVAKVVQSINEKTKDFAGMKVPVKISVDPKTREFEISVGTPPTSSLLLAELGVEKGSGDPRNTKVGDLSLPQVLKVARMKKDSLLGSTMKKKVKEVLGTCLSMGITVEGKDPRVVQKEIEEGLHDSLFEKE